VLVKASTNRSIDEHKAQSNGNFENFNYCQNCQILRRFTMQERKQYKKTLVWLLLVGLVLGAIVVVGCEQFIPSPGYTQPQVERGRYLAMNVSVCVECHTPPLPDGKPNEAMLFAGGREFIPGMLWTPNLTPDKETGLSSWTDEQIVQAIQKGVGHFDDDPEGEPLFPVMPYYVYANMTTDDAMAIVAFLRTEVKAIKNELPERSPQIEPPEPAKPLDYTSLPGANNDAGKYLTSAAGVCLECHTPRVQQPGPPDPSRLDSTKYFAGGEEFVIPGFKVFSANITPDKETGIGDLTDDQIKAAFQKGVDEDGKPLCPPMPWPLYADITSSDANAIVKFIRSVPAIKNEVEECELLGAPPK
jgi:mono/diheme cytochrome c family protein